MLSIPPSHLDPDTSASPTLGIGRAWYEPIRPWPDDMPFTDIDPAVLEMEHLVDNGRLGPPPAIGSYGCAAARCADAPLAGIELHGPPPRRAEIMRRFHPADRHPLRAARGDAA